MKNDAATLALVPPSRSTRNWLFVLAFAAPLLIIGVAVGMVGARAPQQSIGMNAAVFAVGALIALAVWQLTLRWLNRQAVRFNGATLEVAAALHTRRIPLAELELDKARVVDLRDRIELRPRLKLFGMGLPGFHSGWYLLGSGRRGFVAMTSGTRVLWIPTLKGYDLLLELQQPQAALERLRERA